MRQILKGFKIFVQFSVKQISVNRVSIKQATQITVNLKHKCSTWNTKHRLQKPVSVTISLWVFAKKF